MVFKVLSSFFFFIAHSEHGHMIAGWYVTPTAFTDRRFSSSSVCVPTVGSTEQFFWWAMKQTPLSFLVLIALNRVPRWPAACFFVLFAETFRNSLFYFSLAWPLSFCSTKTSTTSCKYGTPQLGCAYLVSQPWLWSGFPLIFFPQTICFVHLDLKKSLTVDFALSKQ